MPTAEAVEEPAVVEDVGQLDDPDEPPGENEPRPNGHQGGRAGIMKPLVVLALPGMYLFYKYSQYRREQRELSRRRITERELQHLHHKIDKLLTKLEENEPEMASSQEDESAQQGMPMPPIMGGMGVGQYDGMAGGMQSGRGGAMMGSYGGKGDQGGNMGGMNDMRQMDGIGRMRRVSEDDLRKSNRENLDIQNATKIYSEGDTNSTVVETVASKSEKEHLPILNEKKGNSDGDKIYAAETTTTKSEKGTKSRRRRQATENTKEIGTLGYDGGYDGDHKHCGDHGDYWGHGGYGGYGGHGDYGDHGGYGDYGDYGGHDWDDDCNHGHGSWSKGSSSKKH